MRKFSSYGPVNKKLHFYVPRTELVDQTCQQLLGENPEEGGHYITIWAPRQTGKTWLLQQVEQRLNQNGDFEVAILTMQSAKTETTDAGVLNSFVKELSTWFERPFPQIESWGALSDLFTDAYFDKPLILIIDEFDALENSFINRFANEFRTVYTRRSNQMSRPAEKKSNLLHGLALIGVRSVLGIENVTGSPFNVQRSVQVPNLTNDEVASMFRWYEEESGQQMAPEVVAQIFYETQGQPGIVSWLGELLTETYNSHNPIITLDDFKETYAAAVQALPNNNILNIISKAKEERSQPFVLEVFQTAQKIEFRYDEPVINYLYMNGVVDQELVRDPVKGVIYYVKFPSPFVQKRLFNYYSYTLFHTLDRPFKQLEDLDDIITEDALNIKNLMRRYELYLRENSWWMFKEIPRRADLRPYEAVYHFNLYMYLWRFLGGFDAAIIPEFPTGNGQIDLAIKYQDAVYGLEVKSFFTMAEHRKALAQAARYGKRLGVSTVWLIVFVESVDEEQRNELETLYLDSEQGVQVEPVFVQTGDGRVQQSPEI